MHTEALIRLRSVARADTQASVLLAPPRVWEKLRAEREALGADPTAFGGNCGWPIEGHEPRIVDDSEVLAYRNLLGKAAEAPYAESR